MVKSPNLFRSSGDLNLASIFSNAFPHRSNKCEWDAKSLLRLDFTISAGFAAIVLNHAFVSLSSSKALNHATNVSSVNVIIFSGAATLLLGVAAAVLLAGVALRIFRMRSNRNVAT